MTKRMPKSLKIFTEPRADASGLVSVHPSPAGSVLVRRTLDGWLAHSHESEAPEAPEAPEEPHFVSIDAIRLNREGPWRSWPSSIGGREFLPEPFSIADRQEVSGGPDGAAIKIMAQLGTFSIASHGDRVLLFSGSSVIVGPLEEWRPRATGIEVPESVLGALRLGPDEFEISEDRLFVRAAGSLRMSTRVEQAECAMSEELIGLAVVEGPKVETIPDALKAVKKLDVRVGALGEHKKYSAAIAPGWIFASAV